MRRLTRTQRAWCAYDGANSVFKISVLTVFFSAHLTDVAAAEARSLGRPCPTTLRDCAVPVLGVPVQAGALPGFLLAASTVLLLVVLPLAGAAADRAPSKRGLLGVFAVAGAAATAGLAVMGGTSWRLGALLFALAVLCYNASVVVYYAFLPEVATPDERDSISSLAWSIGFLGGGVCLAVNIAMVVGLSRLGWSQQDAIRACFVVAGLWWAVFTGVSLRGLPCGPPEGAGTEAPAAADPDHATGRAGAGLGGSLRDLARTVSEARRYPVTLLFLAAFMIYIDGINTANVQAGLYAVEQLGLPLAELPPIILVVQFVAFGGGLLGARLAGRIGAQRTLVAYLAAWAAVLVGAYLIEAGQRLQFYAVALGIGLVVGAPAALSRSVFSQLVPPGRVAEYFSLYTLGERGASAVGPLVFSLVASATGSFRPAILSLVGFLVVGGALLALLPVRRGIRAAGNPEPRLV